MMSTEEYARKLKAKKARDRYHRDADYRAKRLAQASQRHAERYRTDEAYRARLVEASRRRRRKAT